MSASFVTGTAIRQQERVLACSSLDACLGLPAAAGAAVGLLARLFDCFPMMEASRARRMGNQADAAWRLVGGRAPAKAFPLSGS